MRLSQRARPQVYTPDRESLLLEVIERGGEGVAGSNLCWCAGAIETKERSISTKTCKY
jgi:hypothetical protein